MTIDIDQLALDAAKDIIELPSATFYIGGRPRATARIQCIIADAIRDGARQAAAEAQEEALRRQDLEAQLQESLERERALAAQVRAAQCIAARWQGNEDNMGQVLTALEVWATRVDCDPDGDLARLKAQWQAEALDEMSDEFEVHERARMVLHWRAQKLRRQADQFEGDSE